MTKPAIAAEGDQNAKEQVKPSSLELPSQSRIILDSDDVARIVERARREKGKDWVPTEGELNRFIRLVIIEGYATS